MNSSNNQNIADRPAQKPSQKDNTLLQVIWQDEALTFHDNPRSAPQYDSLANKFISSGKFLGERDGEGLFADYLNFDIESRKQAISCLEDESLHFSRTANDFDFTKKLGTQPLRDFLNDEYLDTMFDAKPNENEQKLGKGEEEEVMDVYDGDKEDFDEDDLLNESHGQYLSKDLNGLDFDFTQRLEDRVSSRPKEINQEWNFDQFEYDSVPRLPERQIANYGDREERYCVVENEFDPFCRDKELTVPSNLNDIIESVQTTSWQPKTDHNNSMSVRALEKPMMQIGEDYQFEDESERWGSQQNLVFQTQEFDQAGMQLKLLDLSLQSDTQKQLQEFQPHTTEPKDYNTHDNKKSQSYKQSIRADFEEEPHFSFVSAEGMNDPIINDPKTVFSKATFQNFETMRYEEALQNELAALENRAKELKDRERMIKSEAEYWRERTADLNAQILQMQLKHNELLPLLTENYSSAKRDELEISAIAPPLPQSELEANADAQSFFFDPSILVQNTTACQHSLLRLRSNRKSVNSYLDGDSPEQRQQSGIGTSGLKKSSAESLQLRNFQFQSNEQTKKSNSHESGEDQGKIPQRLSLQELIEADEREEQRTAKQINQIPEIGYLNYQTFAQKTCQFQTLGTAQFQVPKATSGFEARHEFNGQQAIHDQVARQRTLKSGQLVITNTEESNLLKLNIPGINPETQRVQETRRDSGLSERTQKERPLGSFVDDYLSNHKIQQPISRQEHPLPSQMQQTEAPEPVGDLIKKFESRARDYESKRQELKKPLRPIGAVVISGNLTRATT